MKLLLPLLLSTTAFAQSYNWPSTGSSGGGGVTSLNSLIGDLNLVAGTNITITPSGTNITISSSGGGGGITALTGDVAASGSGSVPATLATVNSNVGSFGDATHVGSFTVNGKGLITAASSVTITGASPVGSALASTDIWVGNGSGLAAAVALSGDATLSNSGVLSLANTTTARTNIGLGTGSTPSFTGLTLSGTGTANAFIPAYTTTATAAGTTTLTSSSTQQQYFTGSTTQTLVLPVTSTLSLGMSYSVVNNSTGNVTVQSSGANNIQVMSPGSSANFTVILTTGTTAASWSFQYFGHDLENPGMLISGTTYTTPATINTNTRFKFTIVGGGGGGGGSATLANNLSAGGAGGGVCVLYISGLTPSTGYTIAIGAAGAGGAAGANVGVTGGNTTLTIGATTYTASGGTGGGTGAAASGGTGGGTTNCTGTAIAITGQNGAAVPIALSTNEDTPIGGSSGMGFGLGAQPSSSAAAVPGVNATGFGGGGSGSRASGGTGEAGGNGTQGMILVEYWN